VNAPYLLRLASLSLASFFVMNMVCGAILECASGFAIRFVSGMRACAAARFLFALRIAPAAVPVFAIAALCIPSYVWLEPDAVSERIGLFCAAAAISGAALWTFSIARSVRAVAESRRYLRSCFERGERRQLAGGAALIVSSNRTTVLAGLLSPVVVVSRDVAEALTAEQLDVAVLHERSHAVSRDNLKRLAILLAPGLFSLNRLEQAWKRLAEWAADDVAVSGDRSRSLALAEALVRVARMGPGPQPSALTTSLLGDDFTARIDRLLNSEPGARSFRWQPVAAVLAAFAIVLLRPSTLAAVHQALERLMH